MSSATKVLIVGPSWVGDMVMAQSLFRELKRLDASVELHVAGPPWSVPVLERMPEVARAVELAVGHGRLELGKRWRLGRRLRAERYDRAIVLPRSLKAALLPFFARVRQRTGYRGEWRYGLINDMRAFDAERLDQTVLRFVALAAPAGSERPATILFPKLTVDRNAQSALGPKLGIRFDRPIVALMPGAEYGPAKQWPVDYYAELARELAAAGCAIWVLGSAKEAALGDAIAAGDANGAVHNLCGATSLADVIDLLAASRVAVSNDSGLLHVAAAVGTHVVAIYGSSSPDFTPPLTDSKSVLSLGLQCSPCYQRRCPLGHLRCLRDIAPGDVAAIVRARVDASS